ncbi:hypothetical protein HanLR1_Chr12g0451481 [Helianthus annuus]|nr:hypothetical protein HanHA89_Chr12g0474531 [Helianthus annuus]KAJ0675466.1 hypothetical protein HanLR1_Chr12g0451481 [Helianthus annuus]
MSSSISSIQTSWPSLPLDLSKQRQQEPSSDDPTCRRHPTPSPSALPRSLRRRPPANRRPVTLQTPPPPSYFVPAGARSRRR